MDQVNDVVNTIAGDIAEPAKPAGVAISQKVRVYPKGPGAATGRITRLGTKDERLAILMSEFANCQKSGILVKWAKSQTKPPRILLAIYNATICQKCGAFLLISDAGTIKCQAPGCEWNGVEYIPDELPEHLKASGI